MPFPEGLPTTLVMYTAASPAGGGPAVGTVEFVPAVPAVTVVGFGMVFTGRGTFSFDAQGRLVDADGNAGVRLLPNDVPGANPTDWVWMVSETIAGAAPRLYYIHLSVDQPEADLAAIQEINPSAAHYVPVQGPQGPPGTPGSGGPGGSHYEHTQTVPSATWQVAHALGYRPNISVINTGGKVVYGDLQHDSNNLAVITFPSPIAGTATCS